MSKEIKQIRGQVRQIVKELLNEELVAVIEKSVCEKMHARVEILAKNVKETMQRMDDRSKDVQGYLVRQATTVAPIKAPTLSEETPKA